MGKCSSKLKKPETSSNNAILQNGPEDKSIAIGFINSDDIE
jgi:hypothetical protein